MTQNGNGHNGRYTATEVAAALTEAKGFVTAAARHLGCTRATVHNYINRHPTVRAARDDAREEMKDFAEGKLYSAIEADNLTAIIFYLKCQAKERGYVERQEHKIVNENELDHAIEQEMAKLADSGKAATTAAAPGPE